MRFAASGLGLICGICLANAALACPPPPPDLPPPDRFSGETDLAFQARYDQYKRERNAERQLKEASWKSFEQGYEAAAWNLSDQIVVAEIVAKGSTALRNDRGEIYTASPEVTLRTIEQIRGERSAQTFTLHYVGLTSCGPTGAVNIVDGRLGQHFVIFALRGVLGMDTVRQGYSLSDAQDSRTKALLAKYPDK